MTPGAGGTLVAFASGVDAHSYGQRLGRLRWKRALQADRSVGTDRAASAVEVFAGAGASVLVFDDTAIPARLGRFPVTKEDAVAVARSLTVSELPPLHTLREFETAALSVSDDSPRGDPPAVAFFATGSPPLAGESVEAFAKRLFRAPRAGRNGFPVLVFDDPFGHDRPEVTKYLPRDIERLLDVGCGAGVASATLKRTRPGLVVTGIEDSSSAAARARACLDRVLEGDAIEQLKRIAALGERFDGFLFADVLELLSDPIDALILARRLASPGATLVASVPNVGHLSLVRDLVMGRFDLLSAGLADAGHLRWFDRRFLGEALTEAGWLVERIEALPGAPAPDADQFRAKLGGWPGLDEMGLTTYQWVVTATAEPPRGRSAASSAG